MTGKSDTPKPIVPPTAEPVQHPGQAAEAKPILISLGTPQYADSSTPPTSDKYDPTRAQDATRTQIAWALLGLTAFVIVAAIVMSAWALSSTQPLEENLKTILSLLNVIFGPVIALLGSVIGFYFGARSAAGTGTSG